MAIRPSNSASRPGFPVHRNPHAPRPAGRPGSQPTLRLVASRPDYPAFRAGWRSLRNADEFEALCQRHWLEPLQALRHGPVGFTAQLPGGIGDPLMRLVAQCLPMRFDIGGRSGAPAWHASSNRSAAMTTAWWCRHADSACGWPHRGSARPGGWRFRIPRACANRWRSSTCAGHRWSRSAPRPAAGPTSAGPSVACSDMPSPAAPNRPPAPDHRS